MTDEDIQYLKNCLACGLFVWWIACDGNFHRIRYIGKGPSLGPDDFDEPSECGYIDPREVNAFGRKYVALYNVERADIVVTSGAVTVWPSTPA